MNFNPVLRLYIVRHGETNENRNGIMQGQMDTQLNTDGIKQSQLCAQRFRNTRFSAALSSDLSRTVSTAEIILEYHPNLALYKDVRLRERDMGDLQGLRAGQYKEKLPKNTETGRAFALRVWTWWNAVMPVLLQGLTDGRMRHVLVVSHGAFISTLVRVLVAEQVIQMPSAGRHGSVYNTSVTTIDISSQGKGVLVKYSDISHLVQPMETAPTAAVVQENADEQVTRATDE